MSSADDDPWPAVPPPPTRLGCSVRVRRRVLRCAATVRVAIASLEVIEEAVLRLFGDRFERRLAESGHRESGGGETRAYPTLSEVFYGYSLEIQDLAAAMVEADEELERLRGDRRARCARRDAARSELYRELSGFRRRARRALGRPLARRTPAVRGETLREPGQLLGQADDCLVWAGSLEEPPGGGQLDAWRAETASLQTLRDGLATARGAAADAGDAVTTAVALRDQAMAAFDDRYGVGTESLASTYVMLGMPTLAAAVRPGFKTTGRTGRPSKTPEPDEHPDLVARALTRAAAGAEASRPRPFGGSA